MADIKQAAKWMQEGNAVRRHCWGIVLRAVSRGNPSVALYGVFKRKKGHGKVWCPRSRRTDIELTCDDFLADDWEIAE